MGILDDATTTWREQTLAYARAINDFVARGRRDGWQRAGPEPADPRSRELAGMILQHVRERNAAGRAAELRPQVPPAHTPLVPFFEDHARWVRDAVFVDEDSVLVTVGALHEGPEVHQVDYTGRIARMPQLVAVGADVHRRFIAFASAYDVEVRPLASALDAEAGRFPAYELPAANASDGPFAHHVLPSSDGSFVVVVRDDGVFVCSSEPPRRLFPEREGTSLAMVHAALSPDDALVALGAQDSQHLLVRADGELVARFGPVHSSYPHHAAFSPDGVFAVFNGCHSDGGVSVAVPVDELVGLTLAPFEDDPRLVVLDAGCRVYASCFLDGRFLLGDAYGYVRERGVDGSEGWQLFCGSSVGAIARSPSGDRLAVGTAAGALHFLERAERHPFQIGDGPFAESLRIYFWRDEILRW